MWDRHPSTGPGSAPESVLSSACLSYDTACTGVQGVGHPTEVHRQGETLQSCTVQSPLCSPAHTLLLQPSLWTALLCSGAAPSLRKAQKLIHSSSPGELYRKLDVDLCQPGGHRFTGKTEEHPVSFWACPCSRENLIGLASGRLTTQQKLLYPGDGLVAQDACSLQIHASPLEPGPQSLCRFRCQKCSIHNICILPHAS